MNRERAVIYFTMRLKNGKKREVDLDVPLTISANELVVGLNSAYHLGINTEDIKHCFLKAENPIALLRCNKTLADYKVMNGTRITFVEGEQ